MKRIIPVFIIYILFNLTSCGVNVFSVFNPTSIDGTNDPDTLIQMGDNYMDNLDYPDAYLAFAKALRIDPKKSRALEGISTAYLYTVFSQNTIANLFTSGQSAISNIPLNPLYHVSTVIATNLIKIVTRHADGVIPYDDNSVNLNFYLFNTFYAIFNMADANNNGNISSDSNDFIIINPGLQVTNRIDTNSLTNMFMFLDAANNIEHKRLQFTNLINISTVSKNTVMNELTTTDAKKIVNMVATMLDGVITNVTNSFTNIDSMNLSNTFGLPTYDSITNLPEISNGMSNFLSNLGLIGITNGNDITNIIPDLTNYYPFIIGYYSTNTL
jgi:hypothetical protein